MSFFVGLLSTCGRTITAVVLVKYNNPVHSLVLAQIHVLFHLVRFNYTKPVTIKSTGL